MMSKPRGFALIINNINFEHLPVRNGAQNDELALKDLLGKLYFEVESHRNKTKNVSFGFVMASKFFTLLVFVRKWWILLNNLLPKMNGPAWTVVGWC